MPRIHLLKIVIIFLWLIIWMEKDTANAIPVVVWRGEHTGNNLHCTTKLDINDMDNS